MTISPRGALGHTRFAFSPLAEVPTSLRLFLFHELTEGEDLDEAVRRIASGLLHNARHKEVMSNVKPDGGRYAIPTWVESTVVVDEGATA